jgi:hypothetical protein
VRLVQSMCARLPVHGAMRLATSEKSKPAPLRTPHFAEQLIETLGFLELRVVA